MCAPNCARLWGIKENSYGFYSLEDPVLAFERCRIRAKKPCDDNTAFMELQCSTVLFSIINHYNKVVAIG